MNYGLYLPPLVISLVICAAILVLLLKSLKQKSVMRLGGFAIILAFILTIAFDQKLVLTQQYFGIILGAFLILVFGIIDDFQKFNWKVQLLLQLLIAILITFFGIKLAYISNPWGGIYLFNNGLAYYLGFALVISWMVFLMNVLNWVDGADGVSAGITIIASATIFCLSLMPEVNQPPIGILAAALMGSLLAFLLFNFYPAKIMAGTSGAMFMGFILAVLAFFAGAKIATTMMVLAVPIIDAFWVVGQRIKTKKSIFLGDHSHLHFKLQELGWSVPKICGFYYLLTIMIAILALEMKSWGKLVTFVGITVILLLMLVIINRKTADKKIISFGK